MDCLFDRPLAQISTALSDFIEESSEPIHLKEIQTGKYIQGSPGFAEKLGLESTDEVVGLTVRDLVTHQKIWGSKNFSQAFLHWRDKQSKLFENFDRQVQQTQRRARQETLLFSPDGYIIIYNTIKVPILDQKNEKIIAIYTYSRDFTFQRGLNSLFDIYTEFYPEKQAIQRLLMHIDMDGYFEEWPDTQEMKILFSIHQDCRVSNDIARSAHFSSLLKKVKEEYWQEMFVRLCAIPTV